LNGLAAFCRPIKANRWSAIEDVVEADPVAARIRVVLDAIDVTKAVVTAALTTYVVVFTLTRLDGIPRTTPIIHALILLAGLIGVRIFTRLFEAKRTAVVPRTDFAPEHILMIGSNRLSVLYIKFIRAYSPGLHRIMAV
jgi:FlaA1/EpsC-like NDP-sugar epimerase